MADNYPTLTTVYATDEDIAVVCGSDFFGLTPDWQRVAYGTDGAFSVGAPWVLNSASADFVARKVRANHVCRLTKPVATFKGAGEILAVDDASATSLTLRRLAMDAGDGQPPAPSAGLTGVEYLVTTLYPQIEAASYSLNRRLNIDPARSGRTPTDIYDLRDLREATVFTVLSQQYQALSKAPNDGFAAKANTYRRTLMDVFSRLEVRWSNSTGSGEPVVSDYLSMRIQR